MPSLPTTSSHKRPMDQAAARSTRTRFQGNLGHQQEPDPHGPDQYRPAGLRGGDYDDYGPGPDSAAGQHIQRHTFRAKNPSPAIQPAQASPVQPSASPRMYEYNKHEYNTLAGGSASGFTNHPHMQINPNFDVHNHIQSIHVSPARRSPDARGGFLQGPKGPGALPNA